jgi:hypothetical protein
MLRGWHLFRSRNINAPVPDSGRRPNPAFFNINQIESSATMQSRALNVTLQTRILNAFRATIQYTLSRTMTDTSGVFSLPADNYDLAAEMGRADADRRHHANVTALLNLPGRVRLGTMLTIQSAAPFDITTGRNDNHDLLVNHRPPGVTRNAGDGGGFAQVDLRVTKVFRAPRPSTSADRSADNFEMAIDAFNALNRMNPSTFMGVQTSPSFGRPIAARDARTLQLSVRYKF